ncbi:hypothetical protein Dsin_004464 [Dipteronia sinensis]|uniref:Reverse transcriptase domain-containing protein n=1 Tax=Dipteronia sinensis TaxID=43782 RepID=A0AAE0EE87_9ROSI|nr:hypothetical protein Dsin_004464 [Dipteronia sinensis]
MMDNARNGWTECKATGSQGFVLFSKVKSVKGRLKNWAQTLKKKDNSLRDLKVKLAENSRFFHCVANARRKANYIGDILFDGAVCSNLAQVREGVLNHFKTHYRSKAKARPKIHSLSLRQISDRQNKELEEDFSRDEVWEALSNCDGNKAPGPDGINLNFVKKNWDVIREDFMSFLKEFHKDGVIVKDLNRTFIALIPKIAKPETMKDFRPISFVGSMYKVLVKILANRLRKVMNTIIGEAQMAFVKQCQIVDSFVIASEIIHNWKKDSKGGLVVKLDFEKAYDSVDHSFLDSILGGMGFGLKWRKWMNYCISSPVLSVLVNGSPTEEFSLERGLRQGDPLSPFLFNIVIEALNCLFKKALGLKMLSGAVFDRNSVHMSHLQFTDDTILFLEPNMDFLLASKRILRCSELASGLRINFHKSCLVKVGKKGIMDSVWAKVIGCKQASLPISYLGLPLGANPSSIACWNPIIQKIEKRLAPWKMRFLSKGGQLVLIKAVLSSIPTYYLSMFKFPIGVANKIEKLQ